MDDPVRPVIPDQVREHQVIPVIRAIADFRDCPEQAVSQVIQDRDVQVSRVIRAIAVSQVIQVTAASRAIRATAESPVTAAQEFRVIRGLVSRVFLVTAVPAFPVTAESQDTRASLVFLATVVILDRESPVIQVTQESQDTVATLGSLATRVIQDLGSLATRVIQDLGSLAILDLVFLDIRATVVIRALVATQDLVFRVILDQASQVIRDTVELAVTQGIPEFPAIQDIVASQAIAVTRVFLVIQDLAFPDIQAIQDLAFPDIQAIQDRAFPVILDIVAFPVILDIVV